MKQTRLAILMLFSISLSLSAFGQFRATMHYTLSDNAKEYTVFGDGDRYRYEFNEDGQEGVVIVLKNSGEVIVLMPQQKMAMKMGATNLLSMANDPIAAYDYHVANGGVIKAIGDESINGVKCRKSELYNSSNQLLFTTWFSDEYNFPIKMLNHIDVAGNTAMELSDIQPWTPDETSFTIPEGYQVMDQESMNPEH
ncbi:MAG: hypothetical protein RBS07_16785 [Lentimicrobium sp.]|nr:hypothetical protein [Lentimicrobium sp.]